jgi:hypothetical protein
MRINPQGTFGSLGVWIYRTAAGTYGFTDATVGTNEKLVLGPPKLPPGSGISAVWIKRHQFDTLGYPLHIALVEKLFAQSNKIDVMVDDVTGTWSHEPRTAASNESLLGKSGQPTIAASGPFPADGPIPVEMQPAFAFAKSALTSIVNLPDAQKDLSHYVVMFVSAQNTVWVEFGPLFGTAEVPHLGCQTELGRDMVFGYMKNRPEPNGAQPGIFLQCF